MCNFGHMLLQLKMPPKNSNDDSDMAFYLVCNFYPEMQSFPNSALCINEIVIGALFYVFGGAFYHKDQQSN